MAVGLVLISHSPQISKGVFDLVKQAMPEVNVADAGGTDNGEIGTSALKIKEAIESVHSGDGVAVFFDFGSAVMNAEMAIELLEEDIEVELVDAPLVEGAYAAVMQAGFGKSLKEVAEEAVKTRQAEKIVR
jgi:dihydroxyacetone kinase phosphotransfer subunit